MHIIFSILVGALVGWIASKIMNSKKGFLWYVVLGIVGGALGNWLAGIIGIGGGWIVQVLIGVLGTCLLIWLFRVIFKK